MKGEYCGTSKKKKFIFEDFESFRFFSNIYEPKKMRLLMRNVDNFARCENKIRKCLEFVFFLILIITKING